MTASVDSLDEEVRLRHDFVLTRVGRNASRSELKDLTEFMHGLPAALQTCAECGLLIRAEKSARGAPSYEEDPNDPELMAQLFPRYVEAFRRKERAYRRLLRPHADILEVGSHLGAFLTVAEEWNWRPRGVDVGRDTTEFQKRRGLPVTRRVVEEAPFRAGAFDAVFVWNCFEQLPNPGSALSSIHHLLARHGQLVIRLPNAAFYRLFRREMEPGGEENDPMMLALAYNNLLGFPYLHGHTGESLIRLVTGSGFEYVRGFNSEVITMPFPEHTRRVRAEQRSVRKSVARWSSKMTRDAGVLTGPWIEVVFRRTTRPRRCLSGPSGDGPRAARLDDRLSRTRLEFSH